MADRSLPSVVAVHDGNADYGRPPFHPDRAYPEFASAGPPLDPCNSAYGLIRRALACLDPARCNTPGFNPLAAVISPGQAVVIKPNLVLHDREGAGGVRTHAAVIRCLLDYAYLALGGNGSVVICDAPIQGADFSRMQSQSGLDQVLDLFRRRPGFDVSVVDLRSEWARVDDASAFIKEREALPGDPHGCTLFDLGQDSALAPLTSARARLAVGDYSAVFTSENHSGGHHRYRFSNTVLDADVVLNVAKMKTHQKAGLSGALKNVVGMNTSKDYLPHYRMGPPPDGDEFPASTYNYFVARAKSRLQERVPLWVWRSLRRGAEVAQGMLRRRSGGDARYGLLSGSWEGNDTIWRMVVDINRIARFGARDGSMSAVPRRRIYNFVDGIVAGEADGPLRPTPRRAGLFLHGSDPVAVDVMTAALMGFDPLGIPQLRAILDGGYGLTTIRGTGEVQPSLDAGLAERLREARHFDFIAPRGWPSLARSLGPQATRDLLASATVLEPSAWHPPAAEERRA